jgi:hypothetical protein
MSYFSLQKNIDRSYYAEDVLHSKAGRIPITGIGPAASSIRACSAQETKKQ